MIIERRCPVARRGTIIDTSGPSRIDDPPDGIEDPEPPSEIGLGTLVGGRYRLTRRLGEGAMGTVYVAEHRAINLPVAVKLLRPELLANPEFRRRFQKEADAVAAVRHPNVARFYDLVVGDPTCLVMEYVPGETLAAVLGRGRISVERAVRIAARLCWGLDAVHAAGVIHRDLKPANVILEPDREHGETPKLIDFGLAKLAASADESMLTRQGQIVGTPHYMSPEQISGGEVDTRADVYGLACALYHMLTGKVPFAGVEGDVQVLYRQVWEPPEPPSRSNPEVSPDLDALVMRALAKRPADRFADIRDMARGLDRELARLTGAPVAQPPRRWPWLVAALAAAAAGVAAGWWLHRPVAAATPAAVASAPTVEPQGLLLISRPPGAQVVVDGTSLADPTPTWVSGLEPGRHTVRFTHAGTGTAERSVSLAAGQRDVIDVALVASEREIAVHTVPDGAVLYLDGHLVTSTTPATVRVDADFHQLRAEMPGYEVATRNLAPEDTAPELTIGLTAERLPRGAIMVDSTEAAEVWIDGAETGFSTPTLGLLVPLGRHIVEIRDSTGRRSRPARVDVGQGTVVRLSLNLDR